MNVKPIPLSKIPMGTPARVAALACSGAERKRLLDLGVVDGTEIHPLYASPFGNPAAYLVRGAVIALRRDVSDNVLVTLI
jgi:ferrous iron transport protein A